MVNLILIIINLIAIIFYLWLLYHVFFLFKFSQNKFYAFFFVFMTITLTCNNNKKINQFDNCKSIITKDFSNLKIINSKLEKIILERTITSTIYITYRKCLDSSNKKHLSYYYTSFSGLIGGITYECLLLNINKINDENNYEYQAIILEKWNFLGMEFYTKQKNYYGYFKI
jgi:hypothetical protein